MQSDAIRQSVSDMPIIPTVRESNNSLGTLSQGFVKLFLALHPLQRCERRIA